MKALLERWAALVKGRSLVPVAGYAAFFFVAFLMFAYWTFPYGRVRDYLIAQASAQTGYQVSIGELAPHWVTGVHLSEVKLVKPALDASSEPTELNIEEATLRASVLSLLTGSLKLSFWASTGDGEADGTFEQGEESFAIDAELSELDLGALGLGGWIGLPLRGLATGTVALAMPAVVAESTGAVNLSISGVALGDGKAKLKIPGLRDGFTIERVDAGTLTLEAATDKGITTLKQLQAQGTDLKLKGSGTLRLARPFMRSRGDFTLAVTFTDKYKTRNDRTKALFQLMDFQPEIKRAMSDDGTMTFSLNGPLQTIRAVPGAAPVEDAEGRKTRKARRSRTR